MCAQVAIVHHLDMPIMRQRAFHIAPGTENQIPITPTLYTANPQVQREINMEIIIVWNYEIVGSQVPSLLDLKELAGDGGADLNFLY